MCGICSPAHATPPFNLGSSAYVTEIANMPVPNMLKEKFGVNQPLYLLLAFGECCQ